MTRPHGQVVLFKDEFPALKLAVGLFIMTMANPDGRDVEDLR